MRAVWGKSDVTGCRSVEIMDLKDKVGTQNMCYVTSQSVVYSPILTSLI